MCVDTPRNVKSPPPKKTQMHVSVGIVVHGTDVVVVERSMRAGRGSIAETMGCPG